jgi:hypothetical protein
MTDAPSRAKAEAIARPIPLEAPVTTAWRPARRFVPVLDGVVSAKAPLPANRPPMIAAGLRLRGLGHGHEEGRGHEVRGGAGIQTVARPP